MNSSLGALYCDLAVSDLPRRKGKAVRLQLARLLEEAAGDPEPNVEPLHSILATFLPPPEMAVPSPREIAAGRLRKPFEPLFSAAASLLLIILFTIFRDRLQVVLSAGTACVVYAIFQPAFLALIPFLVIRWSLEIVGSLATLITGRRAMAVDILEVMLALFDFLLLGYLLSGGMESFFSLDLLRSAGIPILVPLALWCYRIVLVVLMLGQLIEINRLLLKAVRRRVFCRSMFSEFG